MEQKFGFLLYSTCPKNSLNYSALWHGQLLTISAGKEVHKIALFCFLGNIILVLIRDGQPLQCLVPKYLGGLAETLGPEKGSCSSPAPALSHAPQLPVLQCQCVGLRIKRPPETTCSQCCGGRVENMSLQWGCPGMGVHDGFWRTGCDGLQYAVCIKAAV